jgi:ATP-dependent Clp protease adaptor protein ClpS
MRAESSATWNAARDVPIIEVFHVAPNCGMILAWNTAAVARAPTTMTRSTEPSMTPGRLVPRLAEDDKRRRNNEPGAPGTAVITKTKTQTKRPNLYRVLLLNDDYTPMEFVVHVLERFFNKDREAATRIMLHVHHHGIGECGVYTYEVAETKVTQVMDFSRKHQHPLQCVMEKK